MTETFSIGQAIATPFHVIRRHPSSVFVWGFLTSALGLVAATLGELFPSPGVMWTVAALVLLPGAFLYGVVMTLLSAPFVSACRQLMDGAPQGDVAPAMV